MNAKMAMAWVLAAGMCMAGVRGQEVETVSASGAARGWADSDDFVTIDPSKVVATESAPIYFKVTARNETGPVIPILDDDDGIAGDASVTGKISEASAYSDNIAYDDEVVAKEGITSFAGTVDAAQFYSYQGGNGVENNFVFNSPAIEQVEEPVVVRSISWAAGVWNPDAVGEYDFAISATAEDIGEVALSVEPSGGAQSLSTDTVDLTGKTLAPFTVTLSEANEGDSFVIKATPVDTTVAPIEYHVMVSGTYVTLFSDNWAYPESAGEIWMALTASPSKYGTYTISTEDVGVLTVPDYSKSITMDSPDQWWFNVKIVGPGQAKIYATAEGATEPAAEFGFTITAEAPVIDDTTMETVSFADGFSGTVSQEFADQFNGVRAQVLLWNGEAKAFVDLEELDNEGEWPDMKFTPSIDNPVFRIIARRVDGTEVISGNAVGYAKRAVPAGGGQMVSVPFDNFSSEDGSFKFGETQIANDLPQGSSVLFWNAEWQGWSGGPKTAKGWPSSLANRVLQPGEGFFVRNALTWPLEVTVAGEVPSAMCLRRMYGGGNSWSTMASPYPVDTRFGDTEIAAQLPVGSVVYFWDAEMQQWNGGMKSTRGWDSAEANHVLGVGEAFCIRSETEGTWEAPKPYTWP